MNILVPLPESLTDGDGPLTVNMSCFVNNEIIKLKGFS